ncbi:MAG TPA: hypothetical protein VNL70_09380, partial [Tepidisphaeraceae bacterium]|nr:hypothetical protein [Tepidisphaeraceae bacterium]
MSGRKQAFRGASVELPAKSAGSRPTPIAHPPLRLARYFVERGWLHLVLLTGVGIFLLPFAWMVGTSLKTDEELTNRRWMPTLPGFVGQSPYVLPPPRLDRPVAVEQAHWQRV